uniref:Salivary platelet aggregation inhibitor 1 n=1 Tax=Rhodnius prolixus TaxID=13249 RepID=Q94731_RHOPR|nr:salivary platelet aggregation inhibitor 1 [Rhodnius prolixus]
MKTIVALFIFGFLAEAFCANPPKMPTGCKDLNSKAVKDFKYNDFFKDKWILTHAERVTHPDACETFTVNGNKITFSLGGKEVSCTLVKVEGAKFTKFNCELQGKKFTAYLSVLATDYKNYALVYRCGSHESPTKDNFLVAQRRKQSTFPSALESQVSKVGFGLKKDSFKKFNC